MPRQNIVILAGDLERLQTLVDSARISRRFAPEHLESLEFELHRASVVEPQELPDDVVVMNSTVWFRDLQSEEIEQYELVFPHEADVLRNRISVLAPVGTALLGYRRHDIVEWPVPSGRRQFEIIKVLQPRTAFRNELVGLS